MYEKILDLARLGYKVTIKKDGMHIKFSVKRNGCKYSQMRPDDHHLSENDMVKCFTFMSDKVDTLIKNKEDGPSKA